VKDSVAPSGYIIDAITDPINNQNETNIQIDFINLEIGATAFWSITDGVNTINDDFIVAATSESIFEDVSTLNNGTLTVSLVLVDTAGNQGVIETGTTNKQVFTPSGYSVAFDEASYDGTTGLNATIDISGANIGNSYSLTITSSGGGTPIVYTGTVGSATFSISNIDLTTLNTGTGTATYFETDSFGNIGGDATDTATFSFYSYVLDDYPNAEAAYSLRKLRSAYTGDAIRVRRNNDNAEQDIGFVNNELDTASLLAFVGANNGFVTTWYDQSTNARNLQQTSSGFQPQIVSSGVLIIDNGKPSVIFDGSNDYMVGATASDWDFLHQSGIWFNFGVLRVGDIADPNTAYLIWGTSNTITRNGAAFSYDDRSSVAANDVLRFNIGTIDFPIRVVSNDLNNYQIPNVQFLSTLKTDAGNATPANRSFIASNGGAFQNNNGFNGSPNTGSALAPLSIGSAPNAVLTYSLFLKGSIQEQIFYPSDQSANRVGIETNINNFYSIYP
jgi:hypothetical protein